MRIEQSWLLDRSTMRVSVEALTPKLSFVKRPIPGMKPKQEFEYIRHGTISMSAFLDVITGKIVAPYFNNTRTEKDFVAALDRVIKTNPTKQWIIIADNLNTHYSASLVEYIASEIGYQGSLGKKGKAI